MARARVRLDHRGIAEILKSAGVRGQVSALARKVAAGIPPDLNPTVDNYTTDRAASSVTMKHARAMASEAKHGHLSRAAAAAGLQVRSRRR